MRSEVAQDTLGHHRALKFVSSVIGSHWRLMSRKRGEILSDQKAVEVIYIIVGFGRERKTLSQLLRS